MFRWEKQKDGNFYAYSGQAVIGMVVKFSVLRASGATHVWSLSGVSGRSWLKRSGEVRSMASGQRALKRAWTAWCEVHGLRYDEKMAGEPGLEPGTLGFGDPRSSN